MRWVNECKRMIEAFFFLLPARKCLSGRWRLYETNQIELNYRKSWEGITMDLLTGDDTQLSAASEDISQKSNTPEVRKRRAELAFRFLRRTKRLASCFISTTTVASDEFNPIPSTIEYSCSVSDFQWYSSLSSPSLHSLCSFLSLICGLVPYACSLRFWNSALLFCERLFSIHREL